MAAASADCPVAAPSMRSLFVMAALDAGIGTDRGALGDRRYDHRVARDDATYIGLRGPQLPFGHGGATVVGVRDNDGDRTLRKHPDARVLVDEFEWGYEGAGPGALAEAILADRLGSNPDPEVSKAFARDIVSGLEHEFELPGHEVDAWVARRLATGRR